MSCIVRLQRGHLSKVRSFSTELSLSDPTEAVNAARAMVPKCHGINCGSVG